ncbi:2TM domain-containing protein [Fluviicola sp.]|uniref:2TM domain-containing protein n=1 Tax=Fluviicola sp. TaxID=1917219 RepID=UPI0031D12C0F
MKNLAQLRKTKQADPARGFRIHFLVFALTLPALWMTWYLTDRTYIWPIWNTAAWTTGVFFHFLGVFVFKKTKTINQ